MSDLFKGITFPWQDVTPSADAIIRKAVLPDRRLSGCELTYSGYTLTMTAGVMIVCGRQFRHTAAQNWAITGATSGYARLLLAIDTTKASTEDAFEQISVSVEYATAADGFPELRQDNINDAGTIYQASICVVALGPGGITGIVNQIIPGDNVFYPGRPVSMGNHRVTNVAAPEADGDAVNLGYANENFVPAGYGLGGLGTLKSWADVDSITANGWYRFAENVTISGATFLNPYMRVDAWDSNLCTQTIYSMDTPVRTIKRARSGGTWLSWEWDNPPLTAGVEYRTTERFVGKVVYCKTVSCGALVAAGSNKTVATGIASYNRIVRHAGFVKNSSGFYVSLPIFDEIGYHIVNDGNIYIICKKDGTQYTSSYVTMYYTKD